MIAIFKIEELRKKKTMQKYSTRDLKIESEINKILSHLLRKKINSSFFSRFPAFLQIHRFYDEMKRSLFKNDIENEKQFKFLFILINQHFTKTLDMERK